MRKIISLLLTCVLCLCVCACSTYPATQGMNTTQPTEPQREIVSLENLMNDTENAARAQLNVGKATTVYGQINSIEENRCRVKLMKPTGKFIYVSMPIEQLAQLHEGRFIAAEGVVEAYDTGSYTISADQQASLSLMDDYVRNEIANICSTYYSQGADMVHYYIIKTYDLNMLCDYVLSQGGSFDSMSDSDLSDYLVGKWVYTQAYIGGPDEFTCEFKADGTYVWNYQSKSSGTGKWFDREQTGDWTVSGGEMDSFRKNETVYVLNEDVFICQTQVHVRVK